RELIGELAKRFPEVETIIAERHGREVQWSRSDLERMSRRPPVTKVDELVDGGILPFTPRADLDVIKGRWVDDEGTLNKVWVSPRGDVIPVTEHFEDLAYIYPELAGITEEELVQRVLGKS